MNMFQMRSTQDVTNRSRKYRNLLEAKKRKAAVAALEELFQTIERAFAEAGPVKEVAILLGSTIISPKETIVIRFPVQFYDGPILGFKSCLHTMFRRLVSADFLSEAKLRHCSHLNVLLLAPRHMSCDRLVHQPMLKPAPRGQRFVLTFDYAGTVAPAELSRLEEAAEMDISGIEPFATDASNHDGEYTCTATTPSSCLRSVTKDSSENVSRPRSVADTDENDTEYIWYRIPVTVKGYRDKTTKMSSDRSVCS